MMSGASMAAEDYVALMRGDIAISDITSNDINAEILHDLKGSNPDLAEFWMRGGNADDASPVFDVYDTRALGVLGCFVGRCANVKDLRIQLPIDVDADATETFFEGLQSNSSITELRLRDSHIPRDFFRMLTPFIGSNPNLTKLDVFNCEMDVEQFRSLALALREGNSLKTCHIQRGAGGRYEHEHSIIDNIEALKMHPRLERVRFGGFSLGRNACAALSDLFRQSAGMTHLSLCNNDIDDTGVEALVEGLAHCRALTHLSLSYNPAITVRGWRVLSSLLEDPNSTLQSLSLRDSGINDQIAILFADALAHNNTLKRLFVGSGATITSITSDGWAAFSKVLCDTTSINRTFLSNHTLHILGGAFGTGRHYPGVINLLSLNREDDKTRVAFRKILFYHDDFDMQPLFEWDLKALPHVLNWLERAATVETEEGNKKRKLSAIYQFIRGMPELTVDGITGANKKSGKVGGEKRQHFTALEG